MSFLYSFTFTMTYSAFLYIPAADDEDDATCFVNLYILPTDEFDN